MKNLIECFLDAIEVQYNKRYADKLYNEHPHKNNMYGLKKMLDIYGIKTLGLYVDDKNLAVLNYPCILHTHGDFVIGLDCTSDNVKFLQRGKETTLAHDIFRDTWTGNALVVQETTEAIEPDYEVHRREELALMAKAYFIPVMLMVAAIVGMVSNLVHLGIYHIARIVLSLAGVLVCVLLMEKQMFRESHYGDKVCSLFHRSDCNSVLDGPMAKIFGISWSEVGLGYFAVNVMLLALIPSSADLVAVVNWVAMLYGLWSVCYQWRIAKSWCVLCVIVQAIIWSMGMIVAAQHLAEPFVFDPASSLLSCLAFAIGIMAVHQYASAHAMETERVHAVQQYRALKANGDVAKALIGKSEYYESELCDSSIVFGNPEAAMRVTILSNPHCNPCARMHKQVKKLLDMAEEDICVQYVFSSFNEQLEDSCRYLIACYLNNTEKEALRRLSLWYTKEKFDYERIVKQNEACIHTKEVDAEMKKHAAWREKTSLAATPTVLVNGHVLPAEYELEDLAMMAGASIT